MSSGISPISSRQSTPPWASSNLPGRPSRMAPVKAPATWPNSSEATSSTAMAPQFMVMKGASALCRSEAWTSRAKSSLPVPVSPCTRIELPASAARRARSTASRKMSLAPTMGSGGSAVPARGRISALTGRGFVRAGRCRTVPRRSPSRISGLIPLGCSAGGRAATIWVSLGCGPRSRSGWPTLRRPSLSPPPLRRIAAVDDAPHPVEDHHRIVRSAARPGIDEGCEKPLALLPVPLAQKGLDLTGGGGHQRQIVRPEDAGPAREVDGADGAEAERIADGGRGAAPALDPGAEMFAGVDEDRAALADRRADAVGADGLLVPAPADLEIDLAALLAGAGIAHGADDHTLAVAEQQHGARPVEQAAQLVERVGGRLKKLAAAGGRVGTRDARRARGQRVRSARLAPLPRAQDLGPHACGQIRRLAAQEPLPRAHRGALVEGFGRPGIQHRDPPQLVFP